jgi:hypothetical protein
MAKLLNRFVKDLDDEAFYARCAAAIRSAIDAGAPALFIDLDWWKPGLKALAVQEENAFPLFNPRTGLLAKRISATLDRLEAAFTAPSLKFSACDGGATCRIKYPLVVGSTAAVAADARALNKSK